MKVYRVFKWIRDWTAKDGEVIFIKHYLHNKAGSTVFASEKGAKSAISQQARYYEANRNGWVIEEYDCTFTKEIKDKYSYQQCHCDDCPHVERTGPEEWVCPKLNDYIICFTKDWWEANCPCKVFKEN